MERIENKYPQPLDQLMPKCPMKVECVCVRVCVWCAYVCCLRNTNTALVSHNTAINRQLQRQLTGAQKLSHTHTQKK